MNLVQLKKWPSAISKKFKKARETSKFKIIQADESNLECFFIMIELTGGHYKGQTHILEFRAKDATRTNVLFPFSPPMVHFITKIFHTNVSTEGGICVDILNDISKWSPVYDFDTVMTSIELLLVSPNNASPYNGIASNKYMACNATYKNNSQFIKNHTLLDKVFNESFEPFDKFCMEYHNKNNTEILKKFMPSFDAAYDAMPKIDNLNIEEKKE